MHRLNPPVVAIVSYILATLASFGWNVILLEFSALAALIFQLPLI